MKSRRSGEAGGPAFTRLLLVTSIRVVARQVGDQAHVILAAGFHTALVAGVCYLTTFVSIPTVALYGPVKNHRDWILSSGAHTGVLVGGI